MRTSVLRVLTYHRILDPADPVGPRLSSVSATPREFERQMRYLATRFRVVSADQVLDALRSERPLPPKAVLLTFDDAYEDFGAVAWPTLRRHRLPVALFVPTAYPDHPETEFWWDRLYRVFRSPQRRTLQLPGLGPLPLDSGRTRTATLRAVDAYLKAIPHDEVIRTVEEIVAQLGDAGRPTARVLGWSALRELARDGVTLAPHTRTHPALARLPLDKARAEIRGSREDLRRETGSGIPIFAYPFGVHDDGIVQLMREEGIELALTCIDGHNRLSTTDPLRLRRTNISLRSSGAVFRARLTSLATYVDLWRHRHERANVTRALL